MSNLTNNESEVLKLVWVAAAENIFGENCQLDEEHIDYIEDDNCSWFYASEIVEASDKSKESVAATLGQLMDKGIIGDAGEPGEQANLFLGDKAFDALRSLA